jgi:hypothetical protein
MKRLLIDGIGPFFAREGRRRVNWSKVPFADFEPRGRFDAARFARVRPDFRRFAHTAASMGFNGITLDDIAHLSEQPGQSDAVRALVRSYREAYTPLFDDAAEAGLEVFLTADVLSTPADDPVPPTPDDALAAIGRAAEDLLDRFPPVAGFILRLGECDGRDVRGVFRSRLALRTPEQARRVIAGLLPVFARRGRRLIVRTWTVGAHRLGDLQWNRDTYDAVFGGLDSPHLVVSMKFGESDFFRFLPLNNLFFRGPHAKIVELQARREYEGSGMYPSFVGWDYERYLRELAAAPNVVGAWVWAQTGGWSIFRNRTFLDGSSVWNEINVAVTARLVRDGASVEDAVERYGRERWGAAAVPRLLRLLRLSDEVVKELLYIEPFARRRLFFRRVRVPPLLSVYWDQILVNHALRKLMRCWVEDPEALPRQDRASLAKIREMRALAEQIGLPAGDLDFQYDTFEILAAARDYYFGPYGPAIRNRLQSLAQAYRRRHRIRYTVRMDFSPFHFPRRRLRRVLSLWVRDRHNYRLLDRLLTIRIVSLLSPVWFLARRPGLARLTRRRAMGLDAVLR